MEKGARPGSLFRRFRSVRPASVYALDVRRRRPLPVRRLFPKIWRKKALTFLPASAKIHLAHGGIAQLGARSVIYQPPLFPHF